MALGSGAAFADYTIERTLGSGPTSIVYLATHRRTTRPHAVKVFDPSLTDDDNVRGLIIGDVDVAASLTHPHIVAVHDRGEFHGQLWRSMDYVDGTDASRLLDATQHYGVTFAHALDIVAALAAALDYAHRLGTTHRNLRPSNVLLGRGTTRTHRVHLSDFGSAHHSKIQIGGASSAIDTVVYASPEQLMGESVDARSDQYALAALTHHLLAGSPPFTETNLAVLISRHLSSAPPRLSAHRPDITGAEDALLRALSKDPADRFDTCQAFAEALTDRGAKTQPAVPTSTVELASVHQPPGLAPVANTPEPANPRPPVVMSRWTGPDAQSSTTPSRSAEPIRPTSTAPNAPGTFRVGGRAKVLAPGDDHLGRVGRVHTLFDFDDDFDVCLRFKGDAEFYAYRRDELEPLAD